MTLMRLPTAGLVVILDNIPETVFEVEFNRKEQAFMIYVVSFLVPYSFERCGFEEFLGDVVTPSLVEC